MLILNQTRRRIALAVMLCSLAFSCKSKKTLLDGKIDENISAKAIIKSHYQNQIEFNTLRGKLKIDYSDGTVSQGVPLTFRMKKDEAIWVSAPLGMVKAYITPERVSFYNKLENEYFDGDFSYLSAMLGTDLDFEKVQNLLMGQALFDLRGAKYDVAVVDENYELTPKKAALLFQAFFQMEPINYKMASQKLRQPLEKRFLEVEYTEYQKINKWILPSTLVITAITDSMKNTIAIEYRNMEFDQQLSFPYKIPKGYKEIVLKKNDI